MNSVLIVVLNWNNLADTERCLASLVNLDHPNYTLLLVDNGSTEVHTDETLAQFESTYGRQLVVLRNTRNLGFAGGVNTGIRYGLEHDFDYIALFNNDAVAEPNWLSELVSTATEQGSALTTGLLLHDDGKTIDSSGDWYSTWGLPFPRGRGRAKADAPAAGRVFGASGGASLYSAASLRDIGMFDETFFAYYEDVDISFRALLAGHKAYYQPSAIAYHKQGATSRTIPGFAAKQTLKNLPLLYVKNVPAGLLLSIGLRFWLVYSLIAIKAVLSPNVGPALVGYLQGVWLFWTHGVPQRFKIQRQKKVSNQYVKEMLWHDLPPDQTGLRKLFGRKVQ